MKKGKATKAQVKKERSPKKVKKVIKGRSLDFRMKINYTRGMKINRGKMFRVEYKKVRIIIGKK